MVVLKTVKIPLYPNKTQLKRFNELYYWYYRLGNEAVNIIKENRCELKSKEMRFELQQSDSYSKSCPLGFILTKVIQEKLDVFYKYSYRIKYHKYSYTSKSFPVRCDTNDNRLSRVYSNNLVRVKIPSIPNEVKISYKWVRKFIRKNSRQELYELLNCKKQTARVTYDGKYWYLNFTVYTNIEEVELKDEVLGIDLGIEKLITLSNGEYFSGINKSEKVAKLEKKIARLQRIQSRKERYKKKGEKKSHNLIKVIQKIHKYQRRLANIRNNERQVISRYIANLRSRLVVFEDLDIKGMLKNRYHSKSISRQGWYLLYQSIKYKCEWIGTKVIKVNRYFKSSQICSNCGSVKKIPTEIRTYKCNNCGLEIDRDYNAAINIREEGIRLAYN